MKLKNLLGQTFGRLTVLSRVVGVGSRHGARWLCRCSCGVEKDFAGSNLTSGNTTSCGCVHREQLVERNARQAFEPWLADMLLYKRKLGYRQVRAKLGTNQFSSKGPGTPHPTMTLDWGLDLTAYTQLVTSPCFYCGAAPNQQPHGVLLRQQGALRNGIDRIDNTRGYEPANCVPCCRSCNWEKGAQTQVEFIENTCRRYKHLEAQGLLPSEIAL